ncbi:MAG: hypothetical protein HQL56_00260 [Magnetococcales bacterium]|nr:hypothetical protein [Magnetococcales bacterium]
MSRLVILAGPSCAGKNALYKAMRRFYPDLVGSFQQLVLFNDRAPRPGEEDGRDYFFRPRGEIEAMAGKDNHILANVRGDLQALNVTQIATILAQGKVAFYEGNSFVPVKMREMGFWQRFPTLSIFLSPLSMQEILYLKEADKRVDLGRFVADVQRRKLLHRTRKFKGNLSLPDLEEIERRSVAVILEMREAWKFDYVLPVYDGEGHDNWDGFYYPIGSAWQAMTAFASLLRGESPARGAEKWPEDLVP